MEFVLHNHKFVSFCPENKSDQANLTVYEVLRLIDGVPLFLNDHLSRLRKSLELVGQAFDFDPQTLLQQLTELAHMNHKHEGNIMLKVSFSKGQAEFWASFIPHAYPSEWDYQNGVIVGLMDAERENPEAKVANTSARESANRVLAETGVYEVLLVDHQQHIREGSRSNFFGIKNRTLYTAPLDKVLNGITLLKVLQIARTADIPVLFQCVALTELGMFDAVFLTGTSPKILPVRQIGTERFNVENQLLRFLMAQYDALMQTEIQKK
ncbi:MAG: aminotransferase class IV, partial [Prolixibacteraceae bacterium]|nr:aminotransferase class IV [Prolixibacteraceae bacterium]